MLSLNPPVSTTILPQIATYGETVTLKRDRFFSGLTCPNWQFKYINMNEATVVVPWTLPAGSNPLTLNAGYGNYPASSVMLTIPEIEITEILPYEIKRGAEITIKVNNLPTILSGTGYQLSCLLDTSEIVIKEITNGTIKAVVPDYCLENPALTLTVGVQTKKIFRAFHFTDKWRKINYAASLTNKSMFCSTDKQVVVYDYDIWTLETFDPKAEEWSGRIHIPSSGFYYPGNAFSLGSDLFFVGVSYYGVLIVHKYSTSNHTWTKLAPYPENVGTQTPFAFVINGVAYVGTSSRLFEYNATNDTWLKRSIPTLKLTGGTTIPLAFSANNKGFLVFYRGTLNGVMTSEFFEYDPINDTWKALGTLPFTVNSGSATEYNGKVYLSGNAYSAKERFMEFDPVNYTFKEMMPPPDQISTQSFPFVLGDYFYFVSTSWIYKVRLSDFPSLYR